MTLSWRDWSAGQAVSSSSMDRWTDRLVQPHLVKIPTRILDVGCGRGQLVDLLRSLGHDAHGLDIKAPDLPYMVRADMEKPPDLSGDPFDLIFCFETLEHIIHDYDALVAMHSWLKPGGRLVMSTPNEKGGEDYRGHIRHYLAWSLRLLLKYAGFVEVEVSVNPENQAGLLVKASVDDGDSDAH